MIKPEYEDYDIIRVNLFLSFNVWWFRMQIDCFNLISLAALDNFPKGETKGNQYLYSVSVTIFSGRTSSSSGCSI